VRWAWPHLAEGDAVAIGGLLAILGSLLATWAVLVALLWLFRPRGVPLRELLRVLPDVMRLTRGLLADRSIPWGVRLVLVGLIAWLVSPVDLVPEFIPVLGLLDDAIVAVIVLRYVRRRMGDDELQRRWPGTPTGYELLIGLLGRGAS
jgi:uncharacterized membrane protein YkvA (DUF1232 family)